MRFTATIGSTKSSHEVAVQTNSVRRTLPVPAKPSGRGLAINGGEFLMLALATCYCNDLYREAERMNISIEEVEVEASAVFPGIGLAATDIRYHAKVVSSAPASVIGELLRQTDAVAEVHNTIRAGVSVVLARDEQT
jgi:organic hydroperoxide reductase OsmC/OhrA